MITHQSLIPELQINRMIRKLSLGAYGGTSTGATSIASQTVNAVMAADITYIVAFRTLSLIVISSLLINAKTLEII
jgi:hypothetical protein